MQMMAMSDEASKTRAADRLQLTERLFGKLLVIVWAAAKGRSQLADESKITEGLLTYSSDAPRSIKDVMHIDDRIPSPTIAEFGAYMVGAQDDGLIRRFNPTMVRCSVELEKADAKNLLRYYDARFPEEISWLKKCVLAMG